MSEQYRPWRKSTRSDGGQNCVEVSDAIDGSTMLVRDSKDKTGPILTFTDTGWAQFLTGAKAGQFDA